MTLSVFVVVSSLTPLAFSCIYLYIDRKTLWAFSLLLLTNLVTRLMLSQISSTAGKLYKLFFSVTFSPVELVSSPKHLNVTCATPLPTTSLHTSYATACFSLEICSILFVLYYVYIYLYIFLLYYLFSKRKRQIQSSGFSGLAALIKSYSLFERQHIQSYRTCFICNCDKSSVNWSSLII